MRIVNWFIKSIIFGFLSLLIILIAFYTYAYITPKMEIRSANSIQIYDDESNLVSAGSTGKWTKLDDISGYLIDAFISYEDKSFYSHQGFDYLRILKAMFINVKNKSIKQGASTISQQYIRNLYLDFNQTWKRKIEEAFLTFELEVHYSKKEILEGYLNTINYGQGNYGVTSASEYYFNKKPQDLTLEEAIMLAGIPKSPANYNPVTNYDKCLYRAKLVAKAMLNNNKITQEEYDNLFKEKIQIFGKSVENLNSKMIMYYYDAVIDELESIKTVPTSLVQSKGLKIYTTLNVEAQTCLEEAIKKNIGEDSVEVASIVVDPKTGGITALSGGKDYNVSQFNRATKAKRQVGSTMKAFLYYAALENNMVSSSIFSSEKTSFNLSNGQVYSPTNYADKYANKNITMAAAIALSDNIFAVKTNLFLGPDTMVEVAQRTGITGNLNSVVSLALGTSELSLLDYANGYTTFASGGYRRDIYFISKVEDQEGNVLYERKMEENLVLNPNYTYILNEMLSNTINPVFKDYTNPSALVIANKLSRKYAIKTGTTNTDYLIAGYNPNILMLVWTGYDDNREIENSKNKYSRYIWADTVESILKDQENSWYETPENVVGVIKNAITGEETKDADKSAIFYYVKGSENYVFKEKE